MYILHFCIIICVALAKEDKNDIKVSVKDIANDLISTLGVNGTKNVKLKELKEKLEKIEAYVMDKEKFSEMLINETLDNSFHEASFYKALNDDSDNNFRTISDVEPKNLYLQLKERMNRDDILKILLERNQTDNIVKSARRTGKDEFSRFHDDEVVDEVLDKMLGEVLKDNHKYDGENLSSIYWDPQKELEDLKDYHKHDGRRIYRGERTTIRYYPFMASIHVMGRFWCGGVLYWQDLVLTTASCLQLMHNNRFFRENPKVLKVRIGSNHSRISGELVDALEVYFHPGYNPRNLRNNIAVIRLRYRLFFNYHRIPKVIAISRFKTTPPPTAEIMVLGWGVTKMSQRLAYEPIFLQRKFLPVYPNQFCKEVYGDKFITDTMFCAGTMTTGEGACDHDGGGPAILAGKLVGLISFGPSVCGYPNAPTVFTLVGAHADWIDRVNASMPDYYRGKVRTTTTTPFQLHTEIMLAEYSAPVETKVEAFRMGPPELDRPDQYLGGSQDNDEGGRLGNGEGGKHGINLRDRHGNSEGGRHGDSEGGRQEWV